MLGRGFGWLWLALSVALGLGSTPTAEARSPARPNLHELRLKAPAGKLAPGAAFLVRDVVRNDGRATAGRSTVGFYLSLDDRLGGNDARIGGRAVGPLRPGRGSTGQKRLTLPAATAPGTYRLLACADYLRRVREANERDNCVAAPGAVEVEALPAGSGGGPDPGPTPAPPAAIDVTLTTPADGSATRAPDPAFAGAAAVGSLVTVSVLEGGAEVRSLQALPAGDGGWSVAAPGLPEGTYTASASQTDAFGRTQASPTHSFRVDRTAPAPALTAPPLTTAATSPTVSGSRGSAPGDAPAVTVKLYSGSTTGGTAILTVPVDSPDPAWSKVLEIDLGAGTYTVQAEQSDAAGNVGTSAPRTFTVDDQGPLVTLSSPADGARTRVATPTIAGTAEAGGAVTVRVYRGTDTTGSLAQTLAATPSGTSWTVDVAPALPPGDYTVQASQADPVGNVGTSAPHTFAIDMTAPAVTVAHPSGPTNNSTPTIDGTAGTAAGDLTAISVDVFNGSATSGSPVQHLTAAAAGGGWNATPATLAQGPYTVVVHQSDSAGNQGTASRAFTVDTTPPTVTVTDPGATVGTSTPTFTGSAEGGPVTVKVYSGPTATGAPVSTLPATGPNWNVTQPTALSDGQYTVVASQTDAAGNPGTSAPRTFTIDTVGPNVTLTQPAEGAITNDTTPTFAGTGDGTTVVTVKIFQGANAVQTITTPASGGAWSVAPTTALPEGVYAVHAEQSDAANNVGQSTTHQFEVDTTAPTVSVTVNPSNTGVHVVADDTNFSTLTCSADGHAATIAPTAGSTHKAEGDVSVTGEGSHTVACTATDKATNQSGDSKTFTLDTVPPVVGFTSPADGATIDDPTPAFGGPAGTAAGDATTVTVKVFQGGTLLHTLNAPVTGSTWAVTDATSLAEGTYTARAEQSDSAANTGTSPTHTFTVGPATMLAAGDIGGCETGNDAAGTAAILRAHPQGIVQTLGDNVYGNPQYTDGSLADFQNCYGPNWGTEKARTDPAIGNHEYNDPNAGGYFAYFGAAAAAPGKGWYSYELGAWHVVVLNSNCSSVGGCFAGSEQEKWLAADLAAHPAACTAAIWHHPRFTSDQFTGLATNMGAIWTDLSNAHADLVLSGHAHEYERFGPQNPSGGADANGIYEIVAGIGGESHSSFGTIQPNSVYHDNTHFGVLLLTLHQNGWTSSFLPVGGGASLDEGGATCRP